MSTVVSFGSNSIIKNSVYKICALQNLKSHGCMVQMATVGLLLVILSSACKEKRDICMHFD